MIDRKHPPVISDEINFHLPALEKFDLSNGMNVYFSEKNSLPIIVVNFILKRGAINDPENKSGLANLTGMTIDEGAHGFDALEIDEMFESLGSIFGITVEHDATFFSLVTLKKNFEKSLEVISWILQEPAFANSDFEREKQKLLSEIIRLKDEPSFVADWVFDYYLSNGTPYMLPNIGTSESIQKIEAEDVKKFYVENYSPENFFVTAVGNIGKEELDNLLGKYFGNWKNKTSNSAKKFSPEKTGKRIILVNKPDAAQSEIRIGNIASPRHSSDYFPKKIVNTILGGQFSSRLNHNLREEKGITYGVRTSFSHNVNFGFFEASAAVDSENTLLAVNEFFKEFESIRENVDNDEIEFAKSYLKKTFPSQLETYSKIVANISTQIIFDLPNDFFSTYIENINKPGKREITEAARRNILPGEMLTVIVGNAENFAGQLEKSFPEAEVTILNIGDLGI